MADPTVQRMMLRVAACSSATATTGMATRATPTTLAVVHDGPGHVAELQGLRAAVADVFAGPAVAGREDLGPVGRLVVDHGGGVVVAVAQDAAIVGDDGEADRQPTAG